MSGHNERNNDRPSWAANTAARRIDGMQRRSRRAAVVVWAAIIPAVTAVCVLAGIYIAGR